jgi:DinB superfamily
MQMVKLIKWLDREFDFTQPAGLMPVNLERLMGSVHRVEKLFSECSDPELSYRNSHKWSIKENIGHLIDVEDLHETRFKQILRGETALVAADMTNRKTGSANHNSRYLQRTQYTQNSFC